MMKVEQKQFQYSKIGKTFLSQFINIEKVGTISFSDLYERYLCDSGKNIADDTRLLQYKICSLPTKYC